MPRLTCQQGASSSADTEGTSSEVCQACLKKHFTQYWELLFKYFGARPEWLAQSHARWRVEVGAWCVFLNDWLCCCGELCTIAQDLGCLCDPIMMPVTIQLPQSISLPFCTWDCFLCVTPSIKTARRAVDQDSCPSSVLSSTVPLLTPAVAASWGLMVSCVYF